MFRADIISIYKQREEEEKNCIPHTIFPRVLIAISHMTRGAFQCLSRMGRSFRIGFGLV